MLRLYTVGENLCNLAHIKAFLFYVVIKMVKRY